ncbi:MAG: sulfurtransferase [Steroidobacteraceae bacterium]|jgi:thiosulfate/3-mercaptopyruvate sulfurtransferase|nr:sulfurtransferase [Steroidobacteraceae bacterium]
MTHRTLVDAATLAARLGDAGWRLVDCRFDLAKPDAGLAAYRESHLPGAVYAHLDHDLSAPRTERSGRHPLPLPAALAHTFGRWGIDADVQVVAYDDSAGMYAARLWWLLRWLGHERVAVLDGGLRAWREGGHPLTTAEPSVAPRVFVANPRPRATVGADELAGLLEGDACRLLDARAAERFEGRVEPLDPKAGHVPGARNHPYTRNLGDDGRFLPEAQLRERLLERLRGRGPSEVVSMCGSGVTACHTLLALEIAGLPGARLYPGSWSEWSRDPARPVATGPAE